MGVSQLRRAKFYHRVGRVRAMELVKWAVTIVLALWYFVTLQWSKARYLLMLRYNITRGLYSK